MYRSVIKAGTYRASSIKIAEAAKIVENTQRDLNIALINELAIIFERLDIDTGDVLEAAGTKWNFLPFKPGLVGGHCIGVDPYYLTYKAEQVGYYPQVVLAGRRINDNLAPWLAELLIKQMAIKKQVIYNSNILVLGLTFKENCPDLRNSRVIQLIGCLKSYGCILTIVDPCVKASDPLLSDINVHSRIPDSTQYQAVIAAVAHDEFTGWPTSKWENLIIENGVFLDLKQLIPRELGAIRL